VKTDDLIVRLAQSATPVTPLTPPSVRLARWTAVSLAVAALAVFVIGPRINLSAALGRGPFAGSLVLLLVATISSAGAALVASVPGAERSPLVRAVPILAFAGWVGLWLVLALSSTRVGRVLHSACAIEILGIAIVCGVTLFVMIRRAAPLRKSWTAAMACVAAVTIGAAATQIICPVDDATHQLVGHALTAIVVGAAGTFLGRRAIHLSRLTMSG
jgi:hypothetical protein